MLQLLTKILKELEDPKNREIVNSGQTLANVYISEGEPQLKINESDGISIIDGLQPCYQFCFIRHCINLLPCFDAENPNYKFKIKTPARKLPASYNMMMGMNLSEAITDITSEQWDYMSIYPKTIQQALLCSGAMTVEDLEQEYLKLTK